MIKDTVRKLCKRNGITVQKLEEEVNLSNGTITKWDKVKPKAESLAKVAAYFGVTIDYLIDKAKEETPVVTPTTDQFLADEAYNLIVNMPPEMQKAALAQLKALADLNK